MDDVSEEPIARTAAQKTPSASQIIRIEYSGKANAAMHNPRLMTSGPQSISPEERWQAIAVMAYHLARARGFVGEAVKYWLAAEAKVDAELAIHRSPM